MYQGVGHEALVAQLQCCPVPRNLWPGASAWQKAWAPSPGRAELQPSQRENPSTTQSTLSWPPHPSRDLAPLQPTGMGVRVVRPLSPCTQPVAPPWPSRGGCWAVAMGLAPLIGDLSL